MTTIQAIKVRNQFKGKIKAIIEGSMVSEVDVETPAGTVTSVITTRSVKDLGLVIDSEVIALVKGTEVSLAKIYIIWRQAFRRISCIGMPKNYFVLLLYDAIIALR